MDSKSEIKKRILIKFKLFYKYLNYEVKIFEIFLFCIVVLRIFFKLQSKAKKFDN